YSQPIRPRQSRYNRSKRGDADHTGCGRFLECFPAVSNQAASPTQRIDPKGWQPPKDTLHRGPETQRNTANQFAGSADRAREIGRRARAGMSSNFTVLTTNKIRENQ